MTDPKNRERTAAYRKRVGPDVIKDQRLRHLYGIDLDEYNARLAAQDYHCPICLRLLTFLTPHVDHDHETGEVRAILCGTCNQAVGMIGESFATAERLVEYLRKHGK